MTFIFELPTFSNIFSYRFFIYSLSHLNIISSFFFYSFFNISLFFLYSFLTTIFFKFPTTIFFKFHNIFKFCSKREQEDRIFFFFISVVWFCWLTSMISWCWNLRRQQEESKKNYKGRASFHLFCEKQRRKSIRKKRKPEEKELIW